jgi:hypothetical protein
MQRLSEHINLSSLSALQGPYVKLMFDVMGRAMEAASQIDSVFERELKALSPDFVFEMCVKPNGPGLVMQKLPDGSLKYLGANKPRKPDLSIQFKHLAHAFLVLSFQESTARAFANDRMIVDGEISHALKMVRCLNQLETFILPRLVAERAIKRYPKLSVQEKLKHGARIYSRVATNFLKPKTS